MEGTIETDGETQIVELDVVTCTMNVKLSRGAAAAEPPAAEGEKNEKPGVRTPLVGGAVVRGKDDLPPLPFCEHCDREEGWWIAIVDHAANFVLSYRKLDKRAVLAAQREPRGHVAELKFNVPSAGAYALSVMVLSDYWIGADARYPVKIKVGRRTPELLEKRAAAAAGKTAAGKKKLAAEQKKAAAAAGKGDVAADAAEGAGAEPEPESSDDDSGSDSDDEGREHDPDYPSEETGTEESSDEETEEEFLKRGRQRREEQAAQLKSDAAKILAENKEGDAASPAGKSAGEVEPAASAN